ncbi:hypothetical protein JCM8097_008967 [Rhodosporidiobolus ruineniae]
MSAIYSIFTSPHHPPVPDHLPTLIVTPHGRPGQILYTYLHTNLNSENYLLTPSEAGDLCVAKLRPPEKAGAGGRSGASSASHGSGGGGGRATRCEASRSLRWSISQTGIQNPIYKLTLPNPETPGEDQPLFQCSRPNPNSPWWSLFYFAYAGHLIPPRRVEFGRISKNPPEAGGGTRVAITGKSDDEKAVWKTLGEGNEDMVEWIVICAALTILDDEIITAAERAGVPVSGPSSSPAGVGAKMRGSPQKQRSMPLRDPGHGLDPRLMAEPARSRTAPPQQPMPMPHQHQHRGPPPPQQHHQPPPPQHQHYQQPPPPDTRMFQQQRQPEPHYAQQQQQQQLYPPQQAPQQQQQPYHPPPPSSHHPQQPPHPTAPSAGRQPSSYRPGPPRPGPPSSHGHGHGNGYAEPPMPGPMQGGYDGGAAARMVQQQVEARRGERGY